MTQPVPYAVRPATPGTWADVVGVMGTRGDPAGCWCQWWHLRNDRFDCPATEKRAMLRDQVSGADPPPGVLAYDERRPVGWAQVGPKPSYARLGATRVALPPKGEEDPSGLWAVTCFVVPVGLRRKGVATALLEGAVAFARTQGAALLEGYPVDTAKRRVSSAELFHGSASMFLGAGFTEVRRPTPTRPVVRLKL